MQPTKVDSSQTSSKPWLPEGIVDTDRLNYSGNRIRFHESMIPKFNKASEVLKKQGINLQIEDSFRYRDVQQAAYDKSQKTGFKKGLVALPDSSRHVTGKAFDLAQIPEMKDPRVAKALREAGFIQSRPDDEWWHWSL